MASWVAGPRPLLEILVGRRYNQILQLEVLIINRRFAAIALWCRETTIPAAVFVALVTVNSPANNAHPIAVADLSPITANGKHASEPKASAINPAATPEMDAPTISQPVLAALGEPEVRPVKRSPDELALPDDFVGPQPDEVYEATRSIEIVDECLVLDTCVDRFLWQLYQRTPKEDSVKESRQRQVTLRKNGKIITVARTSTSVVDEDFAWKDPDAAKNAGMSLTDYVIGGVDRDFKLKLFQMLHAAEQAGLAPGMTSGFRDDYRQSIASGLKAANNRSYHGGSLRGGYGHGLAADIVSIKGATRAERLGNSHMLWKWVDKHGSEFGIGRPYLDRDPPHLAPIDGEEYARHRSGVRARQAAAKPN